MPKAVVAKELARMLVMDGQPFATVMRPGFRGFMEAVGRPLVHRRSVERAYERMYEAEVKGKITSHVAMFRKEHVIEAVPPVGGAEGGGGEGEEEDGEDEE